LEKKHSNLRRENNELQKLLQAYEKDTTNEDDADVIMNTIFNEPVNTSEEFVEITQCVTTDCTDDKCVVQEIANEPLIHNIITEAFDAKPEELPVADAVSEHDVEIESVVSENNGHLNRKKLSKMNLDKLKEICLSMNLSTDGTKNILIDRILS